MAFSFRVEPDGKLTLLREGEAEVKDVRIKRAFPWSDPTHFVSVRTHEGKEILLIEDLGALESPLAKQIVDWLETHSFIPKISRVVKLNLDFGFQEWTVETDRGPRTFRVQEREDIRFLNDGRFSVKDVEGNVYELMSLAKLDEESRKRIETVI